MTTATPDNETLYEFAEDIATEALYWAIGRNEIADKAKRAADDRLETELGVLFSAYAGLRPSHEEIEAFRKHLVSTVYEINGSDVL